MPWVKPACGTTCRPAHIPPGSAQGHSEWSPRTRDAILNPSANTTPEFNSDAQLTEYIEEWVGTWFHPVGTCRMGVGADCVVDPKLGVIGASGLHVADASIMPEIVSVNTNAASMMIGWRAGDLLLG